MDGVVEDGYSRFKKPLAKMSQMLSSPGRNRWVILRHRITPELLHNGGVRAKQCGCGGVAKAASFARGGVTNSPRFAIFLRIGTHSTSSVTMVSANKPTVLTQTFTSTSSDRRS